MSKKDNKAEKDFYEGEAEKPENTAPEPENETTETSMNEALNKEKDRYLRLFAEFENFKKRTARERIEFFTTATEEVMLAMLPVLDDFDRALKEIERAEDDELFKGVSLIKNKLIETLRTKGLEMMGTKAGDSFNADEHEAISQLPAPSEDMKGKIVDVLEKGYMLGEKIIRYPKVVIGQ